MIISNYRIIVTDSDNKIIGNSHQKNLKSNFVNSQTMDIYYTDVSLSRYKTKLSRLSQKKSEKIEKFFSWLEVRGISKVQQLKYAISLDQFFSFCQKPIAEITPEDIINFLESLKGRKAKTRQIRFYCLKKFLEFYGNESINKLKINFVIRHRLPKILSEKEIDDIIRSLDSLRDKVIFGCLYETGCRISEFLTIKRSQVSWDEHGAIIIVKGKTGERRVRVRKYAKLLRLWLETNSLQRVFPFTYQQVRKLLSKISIWVGKRIYPHLLRHSRATHLAKYLTESQLKVYFGWSQGSDMPKIYVHLSGKDVDEALLKIPTTV